MNAKIVSIAAAAGLLIGSTAIGYAQNPARDSSPGHEMQDKGGKRGSPGASGYAPGHQGTTGQGGRMDKDRDSTKSPAR